MPEIATYEPEDYQEFRALRPEYGDQEIISARHHLAAELKGSISTLNSFRNQFRSKSELGAFVVNLCLKAMQGRVSGQDIRWMEEVKRFYLNLTKGTEASWSGVVAEFAAARVLQETGHVVRFTGNLPDNMPKPRGYNEYTRAEQDRLQGIDWWLDMAFPSAVTVKSMPFTPEGRSRNKLIYRLDKDYRELLAGLINKDIVEIREDGETPLERQTKAIETSTRVRAAAESYGTEALIMLIPSLGNDSNFNRHTGEPSPEIVADCSLRLKEISAEVTQLSIAPEGVDYAQ